MPQYIEGSRDLAQRFVGGRCRIVVIGDSTMNGSAATRLMMGLRPKKPGFVGFSGYGALNGANHTSTLTSRDGTPAIVSLGTKSNFSPFGVMLEGRVTTGFTAGAVGDNGNRFGLAGWAYTNKLSGRWVGQQDVFNRAASLGLQMKGRILMYQNPAGTAAGKLIVQMTRVPGAEFVLADTGTFGTVGSAGWVIKDTGLFIPTANEEHRFRFAFNTSAAMLLNENFVNGGGWVETTENDHFGMMSIALGGEQIFNWTHTTRFNTQETIRSLGNSAFTDFDTLWLDIVQNGSNGLPTRPASGQFADHPNPTSTWIENFEQVISDFRFYRPSNSVIIVAPQKAYPGTTPLHESYLTYFQDYVRKDPNSLLVNVTTAWPNENELANMEVMADGVHMNAAGDQKKGEFIGGQIALLAESTTSLPQDKLKALVGISGLKPNTYYLIERVGSMAKSQIIPQTSDINGEVDLELSTNTTYSIREPGKRSVKKINTGTSRRLII